MYKILVAFPSNLLYGYVTVSVSVALTLQRKTFFENPSYFCLFLYHYSLFHHCGLLSSIVRSSLYPYQFDFCQEPITMNVILRYILPSVTKVSLFGSRFPAKSSYHDDSHKSEKYGGQTIGTVHDLLLWRNKISHCDWSDKTPFACFAEKGNLKIDTFATVLMARPSMEE